MHSQLCPWQRRKRACSPSPPRHAPFPWRSTAYALLKDGWQIHTGGLMQGFDAATWMVIALQASTPALGPPFAWVWVWWWGWLRRGPCVASQTCGVSAW